MCIVYLGKSWHQNALWEDGKAVEALWWEGLGSDFPVDVPIHLVNQCEVANGMFVSLLTCCPN